ncbi:MAG TPA: hypothetical protein VF054_00615 [Micromonosporaceae bacterium]
MKLFIKERPSALIRACALVPTAALAHVDIVGRPAALGASVEGLSVGANLLSVGVSAEQQQSVQVQVVRTVDAYGIDGTQVKGAGMVDTLADTGVAASGVPPRGRPV